MRVSELSRESGVSVATIKYYIREGLLPPGELTAPNQAEYGEHHLDRLRLIRALRDVADLSIEAITNVVRDLDDGGASEGLLGHPDLPRLAAVEEAVGPDAVAQAAREVDALLERVGWDVGPACPAREELGRVLALLRELWDRRIGAEAFLPYVAPVSAIVAFEQGVLQHGEADVGLAPLDAAGRPEEALRVKLLGSVLFGRAMLALRGMAHDDAQRREAATPRGR